MRGAHLRRLPVARWSASAAAARFRADGYFRFHGGGQSAQKNRIFAPSVSLFHYANDDPLRRSPTIVCYFVAGESGTFPHEGRTFSRYRFENLHSPISGCGKQTTNNNGNNTTQKKNNHQEDNFKLK